MKVTQKFKSYDDDNEEVREVLFYITSCIWRKERQKKALNNDSTHTNILCEHLMKETVAKCLYFGSVSRCA